MKNKKELLLRAAVFTAAAAVYVVLALLGIGCPIRALTGIPCGGCGMTRAYLSLLKPDIHSAFYYHPLFWMVPPALILFIVKKGPLSDQRIRNSVWTVFITSFIVVYLLRLLVLKDSAIYILN